MLSDSPIATKKDCCTMFEMMFEVFKFPAAYIALSSYLSYVREGQGINIVVDSGDGGTTVLPMWHKWNISVANKYIPIGGRDITKYLSRLLSERGVSLQTTSELDLVRQIKESCCYVALNTNSPKEKNFSTSRWKKYFSCLRTIPMHRSTL